MRLPRFRLRTLMISVAVAAMIAYGVVITKKSRGYRLAARRHAITARIIEIEAGPAPSSRDRERTAYYTKLKEKYENAASHPWRSLLPDLPAPK